MAAASWWWWPSSSSSSWSDGEESHHWDALLLALASSTDNFTVGLSMGIQKKPLPIWANACISVSNATGAWSAGHGGLWFSFYLYRVMMTTAAKGTDGDGNNSYNKSFPLYLSALAFGGLALSEWRGYKEESIQTDSKSLNAKKDDKHDDSSKINSSTLTKIWPVFKLAVPMTLNNLAGGVAGGVAGLPPRVSAFYALVASFVTMFAGYHFGVRLGSAMNRHNQKVNTNNEKGGLYLHPSLFSALLLGILSLVTLKEAIFG